MGYMLKATLGTVGDSAKRSRAMRPLTILVVVLLALSACSGSGGGSSADAENRVRGCDSGEAWVRATAAAADAVQQDHLPVAQQLAAFDKVHSIENAIANSGPADVRAAVKTLHRIPDDTIHIAERDQRDAANKAFTSWLNEDCGLTTADPK